MRVGCIDPCRGGRQTRAGSHFHPQAGGGGGPSKGGAVWWEAASPKETGVAIKCQLELGRRGRTMLASPFILASSLLAELCQKPLSREPEKSHRKTSPTSALPAGQLTICPWLPVPSPWTSLPLPLAGLLLQSPSRPGHPALPSPPLWTAPALSGLCPHGWLSS